MGASCIILIRVISNCIVGICTEDYYASISETLDNVDGGYATILSEPSTVEKQYAEISEPKCLEMKQRNMDGDYVNISKKTGVVEEQSAEVSEPKYLEMEKRDMDGTYINVSKKPADSHCEKKH
ncbi:Hypothetical predicted protein [Octopus vulgaris]|uniref:Uncharacterized protein n=1 Tax=Octopus vulgaris TaxID=6645 RepID=A0AA36AVP8_OCTVU|nr:Hypothetical predicted protein [Octopus vulgaris]